MFDQLLALLPHSLRGANLLLLAGALLAALLAARRAEARQIEPEPAGIQLALGLLIGLPIAVGALLERRGAGLVAAGSPSLVDGGLALCGGLLLLLLVLLTAWRQPLLDWLDVGAAPVLLGLAVGHLGSALGQGSAGAAPDPAGLFVPLWALGALGLLLRVEARHGARLRPGDSALLYGLLASAGHVAATGMAIAGSCGAPGAGCVSALHPAQLLSVVTCFGCAAVLAWRRSPQAKLPAA